MGLAPALPSPASGGGISGNPPTCEGGLGAEGDAADDAPASAVADGGAIVPRLQSAVVRVLASIEATVGKLAAQPIHPREMEHAARALAALTRTLRELNALLRQHGAPADEDDEPEESIDEFRLRLARQMDAVIARRNTAAAGNTEPEGP